MDFIEQWFHISPDGGSGVLEAVCIPAFAVMALACCLPRLIRRALPRVAALAHYTENEGRA